MTAIPIDLTITSDLNLTANFAENPPDIIVPAETMAIAEGGHDEINIVLSKAPQAPTTITGAITSGDSDFAITFGDELTFTNETWNVPQRIFLTAAGGRQRY